MKKKELICCNFLFYSHQKFAFLFRLFQRLYKKFLINWQIGWRSKKYQFPSSQNSFAVSMMVQQMPEFIGFRQSRGTNPTKNPLHPCFIQIELMHSVIVKLFLVLTIDLTTSKGWLNVMANPPAKKAGRKVELSCIFSMKNSSFKKR